MSNIEHRFGSVPPSPQGEAKDINAHFNSALGGNQTRAQVTSAAALAKVSGLDWKAEKHSLSDDRGSIPSHIALRRSDNQHILGVVSKDYGVIQPEDMAALADAIIGEGEGEYHPGNAGVMQGGARAYLQVRGPVRDVGGISKLQSNVSIFNSWNASLQFEGGFSDTDIVCRNTFQAAFDDASNGVKLRHTALAPERLKQVTEIIKSLRKYTGALDNHLLKMMSRTITTDQVMGLIQELFPVPPGTTKVPAGIEKARMAVLEAYTKAPSSAPGTAWGAFQAVTYYTNHQAPVRLLDDRTAAQVRAESNWWGPGRVLVRKAWERLDSDRAVQQLVYVTN